MLIIKNLSQQFLVLLILCIFSYSSLAKTTQYWADAYDLNTGRLIYKEKHVERYSGTRPRVFDVSYYTVQGKLFATKTVRFNHTAYDPDIYLNSQSLSYTEYTRHLGGKTYRVGYQDKNSSQLITRKLSVPYVQVIDNGFDLYIKDNLDKLIRGNKLYFNYIAPAKLDYYRFRLNPVFVSSRTIRIHIEPNAMLARWFSQPVIVEYDIQKRRMTSYKGVTNIPSRGGNNHKAHLAIRYD